MKNLNILFNDKTDVAAAVGYFKDEDFQEIFDAITSLRQKLFNNESFFEIVNEMMDFGILPRNNDIVPPEYYGAVPVWYWDVSFIYSQLSKAEIRLTQVKSYEKKMSEMSVSDRQKLVAPKWQ